MFSNFIKKFIVSAGLILLTMAAVNFIGNQGGLATQPYDPVFGLSSHYVFWGLAAVEFIVAALCLFGTSPRFQIISVFWITSNLLAYRLLLFCFGIPTLKGFYGSIAYEFKVSVGFVNVLQTATTFCFWLASGLSLLLLSKKLKDLEFAAVQPEAADLKV